ncbi:MAG: hypothetical protein HYS62_00265 [Candidatus Aenigmarchaeota archaeon]|nr:hypothetical protein [Candidatus Aenigmarchaeota archaeon]
MRYLAFIVFVYLLSALAYAGPDDKWIPAGSAEEETVGSVEVQTAESAWTQYDGIALILGIAAFAWVYVIYRDFKKPGRG